MSSPALNEQDKILFNCLFLELSFLIMRVVFTSLFAFLPQDHNCFAFMLALHSFVHYMYWMNRGSRSVLFILALLMQHVFSLEHLIIVIVRFVYSVAS